jgi:hypothetical protein
MNFVGEYYNQQDTDAWIYDDDIMTAKSCCQGRGGRSFYNAAMPDHLVCCGLQAGGDPKRCLTRSAPPCLVVPGVFY